MVVLTVLVAPAATTVAPTVAPTTSCPPGYGARNDRPAGIVQPAQPVGSRWACAEQCTSEGQGYPEGCACLGFTTFSSMNSVGAMQLYCSTIIVPLADTLTNSSNASLTALRRGDASSRVPCEEGFKCCNRRNNACPTLPPTPPTPVPTRHDHCPPGYADYGTRPNRGLGRITIVTVHQECADRCTLYSAPQFAGGCKGYQTGMYYGMLFCRSYGSKAWTTACAAWAVPWHRGYFSSAIGEIDSRTGQLNLGGTCCSNITSRTPLSPTAPPSGPTPAPTPSPTRSPTCEDASDNCPVLVQYQGCGNPNIATQCRGTCNNVRLLCPVPLQLCVPVFDACVC